MKPKTILSLAITLIFAGSIFAADELKSITLPKVNIKKTSLVDALTKRVSTREFADKEISLQDLSNVLWAAAGINRPENGYRTYPSAMGKQSISVYAITKEGVYIYDHTKHTLEPVAAGDFRAKAGAQGFVATSPLNLIYVSDTSKFDGSAADKRALANFDAGHCSENVYLYCAAAGIGTVIRASIDTAALAKVLKLGKNDLIVGGQTVGYFAK
ncbi:MAG: SagB/ThcOx family dehydrogenase [Spirochaetia bacterium]|jgi:SagB-type dehydrogenase family enzyme|nr:SagB/ThcOx family dehydrogenase [Spirochaetia bacterium]